jgi:hypothetical protein
MPGSLDGFGLASWIRKHRPGLVVLRNKAIKPLLAAAQALKPSRGPQNPNPLDVHYEAIRVSMKGIFDELGLAA